MALFVLLAGGSVQSSQVAKPEPPAGLRFGAEVAVVTVPVFVTDAANKAVGGLTVDDFQIEDEGKSVPITGFQEIDAERAPGAAMGSYSPAARRYFLLFFDLSFSSPSGVLQSRRAATEFVQKDLLPSDLGAVATFSTATSCARARISPVFGSITTSRFRPASTDFLAALTSALCTA